jgi:hypothetical protein
MTELRATLPAADAESIFTRLTAAARQLPTDDQRTLDQKRADLLVDGLLAGITFESLPRMQGRRPSVQVIVSLSTLLGLDEEPGDLAGYGPITADTARALAADQSGTWRRLVTDPITNQLLDFGTTTYRPPQALADFVIARDGVCVHPGCNQAGYRCDLDHELPASSGGPTNPANTHIACRRHHRLKHQTRWTYQSHNDGTCTWTSPTGHHYPNRPPTRWTEPMPSAKHTDPGPATTWTEPEPTTNTDPEPTTTWTASRPAMSNDPGPATQPTETPRPAKCTEPDPSTRRADTRPPQTATPADSDLNLQHCGTAAEATQTFRNQNPRNPQQNPPEEDGKPTSGSLALPDDPPF